MRLNYRLIRNSVAALLAILVSMTGMAASRKEKVISPVSAGEDGGLVYEADTNGNRIPDFSCCGYGGGGVEIPLAPVRVVVAPVKGDNTARIQRALDYVGSLPSDSNGLRGAVLLLKGRFPIAGGLRLNASGVVLRGQGMEPDGTVLVATGLDRRTLIRVAGSGEAVEDSSKTVAIADPIVPVGAIQFHVEKPGVFKPGDTIRVLRPCTQAWIEKLGMLRFGGSEGDWRLTWKPGSRDLIWDRVVKSAEGDLVTVDAPITTAIEKEFGGGTVAAYGWAGRLSQVGIENLRCESEVDGKNPKDENHSWFAITVERAQNVWVRQVTARHFAGSMVAVYETAKWVTVQDCASLEPVSEIGGYRRHTFFTMGQMTLFLRCYAEHGRHDFSAGHCAAGPNAFVHCQAALALDDSGPIESWASGVLYDNVVIDGSGLSLGNRGANPHGAGWAAANSVLWQCSASVMRCARPPTAQNWSFGCWGEFDGDGFWQSSNESVKPDSLYVAQLGDRLGREVASRIKLLSRQGPEASNPTLEQAAALIAASRRPAPQLLDFIRKASRRERISGEAGGAPRLEQVASEPAAGAGKGMHPLSLTNGWLVCDGKLVVGAVTGVPWWRGNLRPGAAEDAEPAVTRFVPGRVGPGFTDDLEEVADTLQSKGVVALDHHYGLWYERRRDDHERVRRANGDVWPPFYEMPFSRTGQGAAWNGLSLYDLTEYNPWYWSRLKEFAALCEQRGLVLFHENYFQHNILEAGAHWADAPWRTANNINGTGFPEPPPYAGDKRIFMAEQFYDTTQPVRCKLHEAYIRQCLENFAGNPNVIQFTSAEYTGPLEFTRFWLDTVQKWKRGHKSQGLVALSCTKDVQDAILAEPKRAKAVDVIDIRYWYQTDKGLFAPKGGQNLAPRQFARQWRGGNPNERNLAQMAAEYRQKCPDKALISNVGQGGWEFVCAGGSIPVLPRATDTNLLAAIPRMRPWTEAATNRVRVLREPGRQLLVYCGDKKSPLNLAGESGVYQASVLNQKTGQAEPLKEPVVVLAGKETVLPEDMRVPTVLWLRKQ
jgi:hypothetical protein